MRICSNCGDATVQTTRGKALCDNCRKATSILGAGGKEVQAVGRACQRCGVPKLWTRRIRLCDECRAEKVQQGRPRRLRYCDECDNPYTTTSGNRICKKCLDRGRRHPCPDCGDPCDHRAVRCRECARKLQHGSGHPSWKGGRRYNVRGYVMVHAPKEHPACRGGYVREHVLVMEERLGRYLLPGETVHHVNGVKDDNRSENLELWVKSQPAGQRASDLVAWAREIIATYGSLGDNEPPEEG